MGWDKDDFDLDIGEGSRRGPHRIFSAQHPLGNPAEITQFLGQGARWVSALGAMDIDAMEPDHALMSLHLLLENAQRIALVTAVAQPGSHFDAEIVSDSRARAYVLSTPLARALIARSAVTSERRLSWA